MCEIGTQMNDGIIPWWYKKKRIGYRWMRKASASTIINGLPIFGDIGAIIPVWRSSKFDGDSPWVSKVAVANDRPTWFNEAGLYCFDSEEEGLKQSPRGEFPNDIFIYCKVECWGKIATHAKGFRAFKARILMARLFLPGPTHPNEVLKQLAIREIVEHQPFMKDKIF